VDYFIWWRTVEDSTAIRVWQIWISALSHRSMRIGIKKQAKVLKICPLSRKEACVNF
jgi:hypothetical protein